MGLSQLGVVEGMTARVISVGFVAVWVFGDRC
jgi:hypothetical protein